jgi:hypothetical protein
LDSSLIAFCPSSFEAISTNRNRGERPVIFVLHDVDTDNLAVAFKKLAEAFFSVS